MSAHDVAIVGAGPAGGSLAIRLAGAGLRVALIEKASQQAPRVGEFLPAATRRGIDASGLLPPGWVDAHLAVEEFIYAWGTAPRVRSFLRDPLGRALVLDRSCFERQLAARASALGADFLAGTRVEGCERRDGEWVLRLDSGGEKREARARFLVVATGRGSRAWAALPVRRRVHDRLVCAGLRLSRCPADRRPTVEALESGWTYSVALPGDRFLACFFTDADLLRGRPRIDSLERLASEVRGCAVLSPRVEELIGLGARAEEAFLVSAAAASARPAHGDGWCLIGDAAQCFDPLSSKGITEALRAADMVAAAIGAGSSLQAVDLAPYEEALDQTFGSFLTSRCRVYAEETRWPDSAFWGRRRVSLPGNRRRDAPGS